MGHDIVESGEKPTTLSPIRKQRRRFAAPNELLPWSAKFSDALNLVQIARWKRKERGCSGRPILVQKNSYKKVTLLLQPYSQVAGDGTGFFCGYFVETGVLLAGSIKTLTQLHVDTLLFGF